MTAVRALTQVFRDPLDPEVFGRLGVLALRVALGFGLLIIGFGVWKSLTLLALFLGFLVALVAGWWLFQRPVLNLCTLILGFTLIAGFEDGTQPTEVLYGLYYMAFLGHWYLTRVFLYRERIFETRESRVLIAFLILATASVGLTILFGGDLRFFIGEWLSLSFLALYFPVREVVTRHKYGLHAVMGAVLLLALWVFVRNVLNYQQILLDAAYAWQVTRGRAVTNTSILMVPLFVSLVYLLHAPKLRKAWLSGTVFAIFFAGLIISQSRGYWVAFAGACVVLLLVMPGRQRSRLIGIGVASIAGIIAIGYVVLGDVFILVATGMLDRVLSIGSAATTDISLINRFRETAVVWGKVMENPILGYGMGVPFSFWDLTFLPPFHHVTTFLHNGYVALWYKFGLWGLVMVLYFWGNAIWRAIRAYRLKGSAFLRLANLGVAGVLISLVISAITSNPFYINDPMFMFGIVTGAAAGADQLLRRSGGDLPTSRTRALP
ncbi:MAG: hypothetical protein HKN29_11115 [Rhodothermales bacterium]|nr:hypothetical protein [Rhodothermales bacterium]